MQGYTPGPSPPASPWLQDGAIAYLDQLGAVIPRSVAGGTKGPGTLNAVGLFVNGVPVGVAGSGEPPTGPAGGDLTGTYPNPTINPAALAPYAPLASPVFTGTPEAPTPATSDSSTTIPTTAFVHAAIGAIPPLTIAPTGVAFGGAGGQITADAANFSWNDTLGQLSLPQLLAIKNIVASSASAPAAGGTQDNGINWSSTAHLGITFGTGLPNKIQAAGSWYQRLDASATIPPLYYNIDGTATGWIPFSSGGTVSVGTTPPTSPVQNSLWFFVDSVNGGGALYIYYNDGNSTQWVPASPAPVGQTLPPGSITDYAGITLPTGWLFCDGSLVSRTAYPGLFNAIGTTYGVGDGSTTFGLPDLGGRVTVGKEAVATRLTTAISGISGSTVGATGGSQSMQSHAHGISDPTHTHGGSGVGLVGNNLVNGTNRAVGTADGTVSGYYQDVQLTGITSSATNIGVQSNGAGASQNVQPTMVVNKIIKT